MSREEICGSKVLKNRFKGIENFLKRVAFNLGNTPSQTDVKIISCIPIDVTDLQQKIIHLEKQIASLEDSCKNVGNTTQVPVTPPLFGESKQSNNQEPDKCCTQSAHENIVASHFCNTTSEVTSNLLHCNRNNNPICLENKKSNTSFVCQVGNPDESELLNVSSEAYPGNEAMNSCNMCTVTVAPRICEPRPSNQRQTLLRKKKKLPKNKKGFVPYVYYAQTNSSPFINSDYIEEVPKYARKDTMTRSYLSAMISKQYKPEMIKDNKSIHSQFSSPICRDVHPHYEERLPFESDICSCCYGPFHNIDEHVVRPNNLQSYMVQEINTGSAFYDTNQYDLVPVKEKPVKIKKDLEKPRKKESTSRIDMKCWPEKIRTKYRYHSLYPPPTTSHCKSRARADHNIRDKIESYGRKMFVNTNKAESIARTLAKRKEMYRKERSINMATSRCSIDFGNVYRKRTYKNPKNLVRVQPIKPMKNAECFTTVINNSECQTEMSVIEENSVCSKTEATLAQIKSILQSVLAEVKISSHIKGQVIENKPKKDAVVQKGSSRNMQASSLMNSITYSPYAMNPSSYVKSGSQQINSSQFCYPPGGMKCSHNFPVFIQHPGGRQVFSHCYRSSQVKAPSYIRPTTTIATNTDGVKEEHSLETEKLIKEIYKSMALTADFTNKDTSLSENNETMKSVPGFRTPIILKTEQKITPPKTIMNVVQAVSELFMRKDMIDTSDTFNSTTDSKSPEVTMRSQAVTSTDTDLSRRKNRHEQNIRAKTKHPVEPEVKTKTFQEVTRLDDDSMSESERSSTEADSDTTIVSKVQKDAPAHHKKEKEGLLTKMFKSVRLFNQRETPKKRVEIVIESEDETSDSDDYQTVYSHKIEKNVRNRSHHHPKRKTHSKISYKQTYQRDRSPEKKRSPYMEQEYRRHWDESLMFKNNRQKYSSERQYSEESTPQKSAYYRAYEARTAVMEPNKHIRKNEPVISRETGTGRKSSPKSASRGMAWLKKHKMGIHCGEQWKKFIREN